MQEFSLYLDHQSIAPLVRTLEHIVQLAQQDQHYQYQTHQLRLPIYQEFINILHQVYRQEQPQLKLEEAEIKLEEQLLSKYPNYNLAELAHNNKHKKQRTSNNKNLQIELKLIDWVLACDKKIFDKKEIEEKYCELSGVNKRALPIKKIYQIMQKYKAKAIIVRMKNGQQYQMGQDTHEETLVKREETLRKITIDQSQSSLQEQLQIEQNIAKKHEQAPLYEGKIIEQKEFDLPEYLNEIEQKEEKAIEFYSESECSSLKLNAEK